MSGVLAIIPDVGAPGGTPRGLVRPYLGKPLLAHGVEQARRAPSVSRIVVSTEDAEVAAVARRYGAEVVMRPAEIGGDAAGPGPALLHVLDHLEAAEGYRPELVVSLRATSPMRRPASVQAAIERLRCERADSLFSARPVDGPVWRLQGGRLEPISSDDRDSTRHPGPVEEFIEDGSIYVFRPWVLREHGGRPGGKVALFPGDPPQIPPVDEPGDRERPSGAGPYPPAGSDLAAIRLLVLDFDGVMTDNRVLVAQDGTEAVWCHRGDGWGIARLKERGVMIVVISTEANRVVEARCRKLGLEFAQACDDKLSELRRLADRLGLGPDRVAYVGNDVNDLECLQWVGTPIVVADAMPEVRGVARLTTSRPGGDGAVREVADWLIAAHDRRAATAGDEARG